MAREGFRNGKPVWYPDRIDVPKKVELLPELSPMENLWRLIDMTASVWLNWYRVYSVHKEWMEELEQQTRLVIFVEFRRRVLKGEYNRKYCLWQNLRSCVWSKFQHSIVNPWLERIRQLQNEVDGNEIVGDSNHSNNTLYGMIAAGSTPTFFTEAEWHKQRPLDSYKSDWNRHKALKVMIDDAYMQYEELCDEQGVEPIDFRDWLEDNYSNADIGLYDGVVDGINLAKPKWGTKAYWHAYYRRRRMQKRAASK